MWSQQLFFAEDITRRFEYQRTEYMKLKRMKRERSGSGRVSLTSLQRWKLERFQFLDPYCIDHLPEDLGSVPVTVDEGDENEVANDEQVAGTSTGGVTPCGSFAIGSGSGRQKRVSPSIPTDQKKKGPTTSSLSYIPAKFLDESNREKKRAQQEQCQRDTFEATLRWIPREPTVQGRPLSGPLALPPPQSLHVKDISTDRGLSPDVRMGPTAARLGVNATCPTSHTGWRCNHRARPYGYDARNK
ncbi:Hypp1149 [Branchiostoma lanceolatum]|uniref:Hypp1149 protein n=1 Tax=Branchiostoma lanceolatum TaxID=7740 RepID=A0A8J9ZGP8_BRALA|nr:Hypp1149 [Branchiostoma lanceolatum]